MSRRNHPIGNHARRAMHEVEQEAQEMAAAAQDTFDEVSDAAREGYRQAEQGLEAYIRANPLQSVLIAAGVGLLVGICWRR